MTTRAPRQTTYSTCKATSDEGTLESGSQQEQSVQRSNQMCWVRYCLDLRSVKYFVVLHAGSGAAALPGTGFLPALSGILLSVVIGFYVRKFLTNKLYQPTRQGNHEQLALEWQVPELTPVQVDVWRAMLAYPTTMSPEVRQMLREALK